MPKNKIMVDVGPIEDLMREHGILNRILLVYDAAIARIDANQPVPVAALRQAVLIIKTFIEDHHEKMEEDYIFPLLQKHNREVALVNSLLEQHVKGRVITAQLFALLQSEKKSSAHDAARVRELLHEFVVMYRPHESREDTVVFLLVHEFLDEQALEKLGEIFEKFEDQLLGEHGFEKMMTQVASIERAFGIYDIDQFTPNNV